MISFLLQTDLVDSTGIAERLGDAEAAVLWERHDRIARASLREWRGREIDKSDGFLLLFASAEDALGYALSYHRTIATLSPPLSARAGLHAGVVALRENPGEDVLLGAKPVEIDGVAKPTVARIMSLAQAGQTLLSGQVRAALPADVSAEIQPCGHWQLKGLREPIELFEVQAVASGCMPLADSAKAWRVVRNGELWVPRADLRHNIPAERDRFFDRERLLRTIADSFASGARLVSLLGIGGIGKTRAAQRYARAWLGEHPGGAWFCDLSHAVSVDDILHAVAIGLDVPLGKSNPMAQLTAAIAGRGRCLIILDNFEQVANHAERIVGRWLDDAPDAAFLVTTRAVLGIVGEQAVELEPLPSEDAVALFEDRATATCAYRPDPSDHADLLALVALMDCLPFAIELAAPRVRVMNVRALLKRLNQRFDLAALTRAGDRRGTISAMLDWSWDLLQPADRLGLAQLSVFRGGFTLVAAEHVLDVDAADGAAQVVDVLQSLIEKSLVRRSEAERFDLLHSVQAYAERRLRGDSTTAPDRGAELAAERRHWRYFADLDELTATQDRCIEVDNLLVACRRATREGDVDAAVRCLTLAWAALDLTGPISAAMELIGGVLALAGLSTSQQAEARRVAGNACYRMGLTAEAIQHYESGLRVAQDARDFRVEVRLRCAIADALINGSDPESARAHLDRAWELACDQRDDQLTYMTLNGLGALALARSRFDEARDCFERALPIARRLGHTRWEGGLLGNLGIVQYSLGRLDDAASLYRRALEAAELIGDRQWAANARSNLGLLLHDQGRLDEALSEFTFATAVARDLGLSRLEAVATCNMGLVQAARCEWPAAAKTLERASQMAAQLGDHRLEAQSRRALALALMNAGHGTPAREQLCAALRLAQQVQDEVEIGLIQEALAKAPSMCEPSSRSDSPSPH